MRHRHALLRAAAIVLVCIAAPTNGQTDGALVVEPSRAEIGVFYDGVRLSVSTRVEAGVAVAVVVKGPISDLRLRTQARVWHLLWAPSGEVTFEKIPALYFMQTSAPLTELAPDSVLARVGVGYRSFLPGEDCDSLARLVPDLIRLKEDEGLFYVMEGGIAIDSVGDERRVALSVDVPANAPPAVYRVQLYGFHDGELVTLNWATFTLAPGAFNAFVGSLAHHYGLAYGVLAVAVALGAGLLVGLVFGKSKEH